MGKIIALFNNKGGVGKTTSSILLADYFEKQKKQILLLDLDQQSNLTRTFFDYSEYREKDNFYDFIEKDIDLENITLTYSKHIDIIPASLEMDTFSNVDAMFWTERGKITPLQEFFRKYDIIIIDSPPAINAFSRLALLISNFVFIPTMLDIFSKDGVTNILKKFSNISSLNPQHKSYKVFISGHRLQKWVIEEELEQIYRAELKDKILHNKIPDFVGMRERQLSKTNIFYSEGSKKQITRLQNFCEEVDNIIFNLEN